MKRLSSSFAMVEKSGMARSSLWHLLPDELLYLLQLFLGHAALHDAHKLGYLLVLHREHFHDRVLILTAA